MASIHEQISIGASAEEVWNAVRDYGALPRLVPDFVTATSVEAGNPPVRTVTFASGEVLREIIVAIDDARQRLVWSIESEGVLHHNGALQVVADGVDCRAEWTADVLPDALAERFQPLMAAGLVAMRQRFES